MNTDDLKLETVVAYDMPVDITEFCEKSYKNQLSYYLSNVNGKRFCHLKEWQARIHCAVSFNDPSMLTGLDSRIFLFYCLFVGVFNDQDLCVDDYLDLMNLK